ncbi:hypothetical protein AB0M05_42880 [Streptomyces violaceusniger]|uniref:hypothetical protein n=1 Tax=Streptomyces violaceusniger TaxID=68280 RepID=UPI00341E658B
MSFENEWAQIKSEAAQRQDTHMRLNQVDGPGGTAPSPAAQKGDLSVKAKDLAAIGDAAFKLYPRLDKDGDHAQTTSATAAKDLKDDFDIGGALSDVVETWRTQVNSLLAACAHISTPRRHMQATNITSPPRSATRPSTRTSARSTEP